MALSDRQVRLVDGNPGHQDPRAHDDIGASKRSPNLQR
jgi:hypothetical protein